MLFELGEVFSKELTGDPTENTLNPPVISGGKRGAQHREGLSTNGKSQAGSVALLGQ